MDPARLRLPDSATLDRLHLEVDVDPVSATRVASNLFYEFEMAGRAASPRELLARMRRQTVRSDPTDGSEYAASFATAERASGLDFAGLARTSRATVAQDPSGRRRMHDLENANVALLSPIRNATGIRHKLTELPGVGAVDDDPRTFAVIATVDTQRMESGRLRQHMVNMIRDSARVQALA